jgi:hypothetical protein
MRAMAWVRPAVFQRPEIRLGRFKQRAGFPVAVAYRHFHRGAVPLDQQIARVDLVEMELRHDELQAGERLLLAAPRFRPRGAVTGSAPERPQRVKPAMPSVERSAAVWWGGRT